MPKTLIKQTEARNRLKLPKPVFDALYLNQFLGPGTRDGHLTREGVEKYELCGTQWDLSGKERRVPEEFHQEGPFPPEGKPPPGTRSQGQLIPKGSPSEPDDDTGWIAQFYLRPNKLFFPDPTELALIGPLSLKLFKPKLVAGAEIPTTLYPDPSGALAMVMVYGVNRQDESPFKTAYDIVGPLLDELSFLYDQPLPIAQNLILGIPSGALNLDFAQHPQEQYINEGDIINPSCPLPELQEAVALYREGVSSNNPFHSFLTLWKAHENAQEVRTNWNKKHGSDKQFRLHEERIPNDIWVFRGSSGLSFSQVREQLNRPYRVALAHGSNISDGKPKTAASASDFESVGTKISLVRYMAYIVIENVRATLASQR